MHNPYGLAKLGVEQVKPIITRGILIDVAGYKAVETLPSGYEVTLADVRGALARQQMRESDIKPGDALLFNFGWWRLWPDPVRSNAPGPASAVRWLPGLSSARPQWSAPTLPRTWQWRSMRT
jgi:Putative cyclase